MSKVTDEQILNAYYKGWEGIPAEYDVNILNVAHKVGKTDFLIGDDIPSWDSRSEEEILEDIKDQASICVIYNGSSKDLSLVEIMVPEGALILSPNDSRERSTELFNEWLKETYGK